MSVANIGKNIAELRKSKNKTAEQLAEALDVSRQTISKWENSETVPNAYNVLDMATYLDVSVSDIYGQILADRIVKDGTDEKKTKIEELNDMLANVFSDGLDEKKNIKEAITTFDRNFVPFSIKIGFNIIKYEEFLRRMNGGYVIGLKESEYPVEVQRFKSKNFIIPAFARFLIENGLLAFFYNVDVEDTEAALYLILNDEREILRFKELTRIFFVGLAEFRNHRWLRLLVADVVNENKGHDYKYDMSVADSCFITGNTGTFDDCIMPLLSTDDEYEIEFVINRFMQLDKYVLKEFLDNCHGNLIAVNDRDDESLVVYNCIKAKDGDDLKPIKIGKEYDYDVRFVNSKTVNNEKNFNENFMLYASFDKKEEAEAEINRVLRLDKDSLGAITKEYSDANYIVLFDNKHGGWSVYAVEQHNIQEMIMPNFVQHPKPLKIE